MLEIRPTCENCNKLLPYNSDQALICSFECTFCRDCVETVLFEVNEALNGKNPVSNALVKLIQLYNLTYIDIVLNQQPNRNHR